MRMLKLNLRVRIFLFFALLMVASMVVISGAIYMAHQSAPDRLPRLLATYTGVAAVIIVLVLVLVWQLFDRYVASALQSLARQMQTALHANVMEDEMGLKEREPYQYLGSVSDAADELIRAYQTLKCRQGTGDTQDESHAVQARQLAAILRDLDVGVLVMNRQHEILLYNQRALRTINRPECLGLARSALVLFEGADLLASANQLLGDAYQIHGKAGRKMSLKLAGDTREITGSIGPVVSDDGVVTGYVLLFEDSTNSVLAKTLLQSIDASDSSLASSSSSSSSLQSNNVLSSRPEFYDFDLFDRALPVDLERRELRFLDYVVFDTETTGLNPSGGDQIISIAAVRIVNSRVLTGEYFDELIHPGMAVPKRSIVFHGITDDMLMGKPDIEQVLPQFVQFIGDAVLVAHNAAFDMKFIELQSERCQVRIENPILDTVLLSAFVHDHSSKHTLDDLAERYGIEIEGRHTALGDSLATARVFIKLVEQLAGRNVKTLSDATTASNKMTHIKRHQKAY